MKLSDLILGICLVATFFCLFTSGREYGIDEVKDLQQKREIFKDVQFYPRAAIECKDPRSTFIIGASMQPFLYDGDNVLIEDVNFSEVDLGDVISFKTKNNSSTMHAVIAIYPDYLITAGYNNIGRDTKKVYPENVTSRVCVV